MKLITLPVKDVREMERRATSEFGIPSLLLMENAGRGLFETLKVLFLDRNPKWFDVIVLCGGGMNGGDGFVTARHLAHQHFNASVFLTTNPKELKGDAATNYRIIEKMGVPLFPAAEFAAKERALSHHPALFVDAMLGTGFKGEVHGPALELIRRVNHMRKYHNAKITVAAADVPSGLDADEGPPVEGPPLDRPATDIMIADFTVTFGCFKPGLLKKESKPFVGRLETVDIGIPEKLYQSMNASSRPSEPEASASRDPGFKPGFPLARE